MARRDREALANFLERLDWCIRQELEEGYSARRLAEYGGVDFLAELWSYQEPRIAWARETLIEDTPDDHGVTIDAQLRDHGLDGRELELKLLVFDAAVDVHQERPSRAKFKRALEAADIPLGSLAAVMPALLPVEEAKQVIEAIFGAGRGLRVWLNRIRQRLGVSDDG
jgi:hypothetical protein